LLIADYSDVVIQPGKTIYFYPFKCVEHQIVLVFAIKNARLYRSVDITETYVVSVLEIR